MPDEIADFIAAKYGRYADVIFSKRYNRHTVIYDGGMTMIRGHEGHAECGGCVETIEQGLSKHYRKVGDRWKLSCLGNTRWKQHD
jgi:hypothetical protein